MQKLNKVLLQEEVESMAGDRDMCTGAGLCQLPLSGDACFSLRVGSVETGQEHWQAEYRGCVQLMGQLQRQGLETFIIPGCACFSMHGGRIAMGRAGQGKAGQGRQG